MALGEPSERGEAGRWLDFPSRKVFSEGADELVDLAERVPWDLLHGLERGSGSRRLPFLGGAGRPRLDEDDVDRVPGGVVQVAGDPHALLRGCEPALPFGLPPGVAGGVLAPGSPL